MAEHAATLNRGRRAAGRAVARAGFGCVLGVVVAPLAARAQVQAHVGPSTSTAAPAEGAAPAVLPFGVGERLTYQVRVGRLGDVGRGAMSVDGPVEIRGESAIRLHFEFGTRVGPIKVVNETDSWLDPERMASLRFHKHEKNPLNSQDQRVELFPDQGRWQDAKGATGDLACTHPLDELSYIYFLRTLPLPSDTTFRFEHHFEAARNPTEVRVVGREVLKTPAGEFRTVIVEMRVRDGRHYKGDGVIRINLSDDAARLPVRIQSQMPVVGAAVLTLESATRAPERVIAHAP